MSPPRQLSHSLQPTEAAPGTTPSLLPAPCLTSCVQTKGPRGWGAGEWVEAPGWLTSSSCWARGTGFVEGFLLPRGLCEGLGLSATWEAPSPPKKSLVWAAWAGSALGLGDRYVSFLCCCLLKRRDTLEQKPTCWRTNPQQLWM